MRGVKLAAVAIIATSVVIMIVGTLTEAGFATAFAQVLCLAFLFTLVSVAKPLRPFRSRAHATVACMALFALIGVVHVGEEERMKRDEPAAYAKLLVERKAREVRAAETRRQQEGERAAEAARVEAEKRRRQQCGDEAEAITMVQVALERILVSPSTADYPWFDQSVKPQGCGRFHVRSYVDSQNGFGAMVRTHFSATALYDGTGGWTVRDLSTW